MILTTTRMEEGPNVSAKDPGDGLQVSGLYRHRFTQVILEERPRVNPMSQTLYNSTALNPKPLNSPEPISLLNEDLPGSQLCDSSESCGRGASGLGGIRCV